MLRIKKLDIFMIKQFMLLFVATFFISQFVLMMQFLWRYVDELIGKGLSLDVMAQFFWYMGLMFVPQALPLALLLSSLITFGNLGESSELTAIKAAGISLMQAMRSLIVIAVATSLLSFYFQNHIGPDANLKLQQLLVSMKQKSPELEIPEGIFYDGIPNCNLYVQKKDMETGKLYGIMIYRRTGSYEDQQIILADSGMLQSTAEKKHLLLSLWSGEWFENMQSQQLGGSAAVPYQRQTFTTKQLVLDYDGDFNMTDASLFSSDARGKGLEQIMHDKDSLTQVYDSVGYTYYNMYTQRQFTTRLISKKDSLVAEKQAQTGKINTDTLFNRLTDEKRQQVVSMALSRVQSQLNELEFEAMVMKDADKIIRGHDIEAILKFTLALSCIIFFFIGAPLGAIIRKGGLGLPVIISVIVYIIFYILHFTGRRMAIGGMWAIWFGTGLAPVILAPLAVFFTYKANNDSVVFNMDAYRTFFRRLLGLRLKRHVFGKEVIINDPDYTADAQTLGILSENVKAYTHEHRLVSMPNPVKVFFHYEPDHEIERISDEMEQVIDDLSNTRDKFILTELNHYPIVSVKAHTRPFEHRWMNIVAAIIVPVGLFLYLRMWMFRLRLYRDLHVIRETNDKIIARIAEMYPPGPSILTQ
ncbi:MAG: LptF/LptG family permease [Prevotella sp.]|nr:LptF/LptG family permease [Prevotella sp.]